MKRIARWAAAFLLCSVSFAVADPPVDVPSYNGSVKITTGLTYQGILTALPPPAQSRRSLTIENNNATDACYIEVTGLVAAGATTSTSVTTTSGAMAASLASIYLAGGGGSYTRYYPFIPSGPIVGTCATTGDSIYVDTQ